MCSLLMDTKGKSVFEALASFMVKKEIPLTNIIAYATDGTPALCGQYNTFIAHLKKEVPSISSFTHCVVHWQHLIAKSKSTQLHAALQLVIKAVNQIKENPLKDCLFCQLCQENNKHFEQLFLLKWDGYPNDSRSFTTQYWSYWRILTLILLMP